MRYYGEAQELGPEEIAQKLVLAQRMLEEIRSRQPFLTQRELVDEEADEAQECMYLLFLANTTYIFFLCGTRKKEQQATGQHLIKPLILNIQCYVEVMYSLRDSFRNT